MTVSASIGGLMLVFAANCWAVVRRWLERVVGTCISYIYLSRYQEKRGIIGQGQICMRSTNPSNDRSV